ncbi:9518_t:CDS:2 [Racocetra fulgida]|uniref:9518_t:CDS:1 n=1 Tax=Racocetra fulgida TaxID=60492 RepID=A0A9N8Z8E6_9GLOM|nr:9518_t:CDS:2 [Racocetra fulgida]
MNKKSYRFDLSINRKILNGSSEQEEEFVELNNQKELRDREFEEIIICSRYTKIPVQPPPDSVIDKLVTWRAGKYRDVLNKNGKVTNQYKGGLYVEKIGRNGQVRYSPVHKLIDHQHQDLELQLLINYDFYFNTTDLRRQIADLQSSSSSNANANRDKIVTIFNNLGINPPQGQQLSQLTVDNLLDMVITVTVDIQNIGSKREFDNFND